MLLLLMMMIWMKILSMMIKEMMIWMMMKMMEISEVFVLGDSRYPQMPRAKISSLASSHRGGYIGCEEDRDNAGHGQDYHES